MCVLCHAVQCVFAFLSAVAASLGVGDDPQITLSCVLLHLLHIVERQSSTN